MARAGIIGRVGGSTQPEIHLSSRDMEHHVALLRNGSSTELARQRWLKETALAVDPTATQAFEEGWQAALLQVDRTINHLRQRETDRLAQHA